MLPVCIAIPVLLVLHVCIEDKHTESCHIDVIFGQPRSISRHAGGVDELGRQISVAPLEVDIQVLTLNKKVIIKAFILKHVNEKNYKLSSGKIFICF